MELKATLKEAQLASCSVELLLPLFKNTVEGISLENVSVGLRMANEMGSEHNIQKALTKDSDLNVMPMNALMIPNMGAGVRILYSCH
jgi:hypothetical protein